MRAVISRLEADTSDILRFIEVNGNSGLVRVNFAPLVPVKFTSIEEVNWELSMGSTSIKD